MTFVYLHQVLWTCHSLERHAAKRRMVCLKISENRVLWCTVPHLRLIMILEYPLISFTCSWFSQGHKWCYSSHFNKNGTSPSPYPNGTLFIFTRTVSALDLASGPQWILRFPISSFQFLSGCHGVSFFRTGIPEFIQESTLKLLFLHDKPRGFAVLRYLSLKHTLILKWWSW